MVHGVLHANWSGANTRHGGGVPWRGQGKWLPDRSNERCKRLCHPYAGIVGKFRLEPGRGDQKFGRGCHAARTHAMRWTCSRLERLGKLGARSAASVRPMRASGRGSLIWLCVLQKRHRARLTLLLCFDQVAQKRCGPDPCNGLNLSEQPADNAASHGLARPDVAMPLASRRANGTYRTRRMSSAGIRPTRAHAASNRLHCA